MNRYIVVLLAAVIMFVRGGISDSAAATVDVVLLQNATCVRTTAAPNTCTFTFPGVLGEGVLHITSGDATGGHRVSAAVIRLNGVLVVGPESFSQQIGTITQPLTIGATNTLTVEMRGAPGSRLSLQVVEPITADAAAVFGPDGGVIEVVEPGSAILGLAITIPAGALAEQSLITIAGVSEPVDLDSEREEWIALPGFSVICTGTLHAPATIHYPVSDTNRDGILDGTAFDLAQFFFYKRSEGWSHYLQLNARYEPEASELVADALGFSTYNIISRRWKLDTTVYFAIESLPTSAYYDYWSLRLALHQAFQMWEDQALDNRLVFVETPLGSAHVDVVVRTSDLCAEYGASTEECAAAAIAEDPFDFRGPRWIKLNQPGSFTNFPYLWVSEDEPWPVVVPPAPDKAGWSYLPAQVIFAHEISHILGVSFDEDKGYPCTDYTKTNPDISSTPCRQDQMRPLTKLSATDIDRIRGHYGLAKAIVVEYTDSAGRKWADLTTTPKVSWNDLSAVCSRDGSTPCSGSVGGLDLTGWVWATLDQVRELFYESGVPAGALDGYGASYSERNATWASLFLGWFTPNYVESTRAAVFGWSATKDIYDRGAHAPFIINYFSSTGWDTADLQDIEEYTGSAPNFGVWLFRR